MRNVFIDCGANLGQGLNEFYNLYQMDENWIVETFEPNPNLLPQLKSNVQDLPMKIQFHNAAIWTQDGTVKFKVHNSNTEASLVGELVDMENYWYTDNWKQFITEIETPCVDLSTILSKYNEEDKIIVKLDIEGSEYDVLQKLITDETIQLIDELYVEWHPLNFKDQNKHRLLKNQLINQINSMSKTKMFDWH
jgi:FkbM family methyltransferase